MFGHWMEIKTERLTLRLGPIKKDDVTGYIDEAAGWGMQSYEVAKYLGRRPSAPSLAGEHVWWERVSEDTAEVLWGVYALEGKAWRLVGSTSLRFLDPASTYRATSGFLLFDRGYWRKGVASTAHLGRTLFAFDELGMLAIDSHACLDNPGSNKALEYVGYVRVGTLYGIPRPVHGKRLDIADYTLVNPAEVSWRYFWGRPQGQIPSEFLDGRITAQKALDKARTSVTFL